MEIQAREILKMKELLTKMLADHSDQPIDKVAQDCDRDYFMSAIEAKEYGLVDQVINTHESVSPKDKKDQ